VGPTFGGGVEVLQKWRVGGGILRGLKNGRPFGGPAGVVFFHQTSKIWSRGPYGGLTGVALTRINEITKFRNRHRKVSHYEQLITNHSQEQVPRTCLGGYTQFPYSKETTV
jgi:hypothetical protein